MLKQVACDGKRTSKRIVGFTLVELLVVIGIIALLISILMPALQKARASALRVSCLSNMRQCAMAMHLYAVDNRDRIPIGYDWSDKTRSNILWETVGAAPWGTYSQLGFLYPAGYMKSPLVWYCPAETYAMTSMYNSRPGSDWNNYNAWPPGDVSNNDTLMGYWARPTTSWDTAAMAAGAATSSYIPSNVPHMSQLKNLAILSEGYNPRAVLRRHDTGMNVVYADGSGIWVPVDAFKTDMDKVVSFPAYSSARNDAVYKTSQPRSGLWVTLDNAR